MTAREYGALVVKYSRAMKKADPTIIISANGHWDINMVGTKERTDSTKWEEIADLANKVSSRKDEQKLRFLKESLKDKNITHGNEKWWNNVLDVCGNDIDMLSIHWYYRQNQLKEIEPKLNELKAFVSKKMNGKQYKWCLSEYNCNTKNYAERVVGLAEGIGHFLNVGFDVGTFWPMRIKGAMEQSMFSLNNIEPQYPYQIFRLFEKELKGNMVKCTSSDNIFAFASDCSDHTTVVISGSAIKSNTTVNISIPDCDLSAKSVTIKKYSADESENDKWRLQEASVEFSVQKNELATTLTPNTFDIIT
jgi:hypothetical protein